jgi:acyl carrier protein
MLKTPFKGLAVSPRKLFSYNDKNPGRICQAEKPVSGQFFAKSCPRTGKQGLTICMAWDIKKESAFVQRALPRGTAERPRCARMQNNCKKETTGMDTFEKIRALLAEQLDIDPEKITPDSDIMSDFEADSLDIVDMVMTLEDEFGIEVPDDAIESLRTVGDVVKFVDSHTQNN